MYKKPPNEFSG
jgi:hypothetical protein